MRIAYLCNRYPAVSLTFIQREVAALRRLGVQLETMSIRRCSREHILSAADREASQSTFSVLPIGLARLLGTHLAAMLGHPRRYLATFALALRLRPRGLRGLVWQVFYFAEAIVIWRRCEQRGIRHIHVHFANVAADVALLATRFGGERRGWSWSFTLHGPVEFFEISQSRLAEKLARASFVICISDFARSQAMALLEHSLWGKLHVVHCGVDLDVFAPTSREPGRELELLSVGRLVEVKGQAVLLQALALLRDAGVAANLTLVGDGPQRARLQALAVTLGVDHCVSFLGAVGQEQITSFYAACDIFCLASFAEGVPVVLMEAMASATPVVATAIAGIPELVHDGHSGLVVPPGRADALAGAITALAFDAERRAWMGANGRAAVAAGFELDGCAWQLQAILAEALSSPEEPERNAPRVLPR